jgi:hypothetical protein
VQLFAHNYLELESYEARTNQLHAAATLESLEAVIADVPQHILTQLQSAEPPSTEKQTFSITSAQGSVKPRLLQASSLDVTGKMAVITLDYRLITLSAGGVYRVHLDVEGCSVNIFVPPGVEFEDEIENEASVINFRVPRRFRNQPTPTRIIIEGAAVRSIIRMRVKKQGFR